jgi:hypothetical protein
MNKLKDFEKMMKEIEPYLRKRDKQFHPDNTWRIPKINYV